MAPVAPSGLDRAQLEALLSELRGVEAAFEREYRERRHRLWAQIDRAELALRELRAREVAAR